MDVVKVALLVEVVEEAVEVVEVVVMVAEAFVLVVQIRPSEPSNMPPLSAVEVLHAPQSVCV